MSERLRDLLERGGDWERRPTTIPGVFVVRMPAARGRPASLGVEVNPLDEHWRPTKRRPLLLRSMAERKAFRQILNDQRLERLMEMVEEVNPQGSEGGEGEPIEV